MKLLLDTHSFIWWITENPRLSVRARRTISNSLHEIYFSVVSGWEIAIKVALGRLRIADNGVDVFVAEQVASNGFRILPIQLSHALRTASLAAHHKDPFDRLLVAQALIEEMPLISADRSLAAYKARIIW